MHPFISSQAVKTSPISVAHSDQRPNVLILDEPTDLDVQTLAVLEDYLEDFTGCVIAVSRSLLP